MLQQTQVSRVEKKYDQFIKLFPDIDTLASSPLAEILKAWNGLGYSRRAVALKRIADRIVREYEGKIPDSRDILLTFPSIGKATSCSILAFAFDKPTIFIETNIRAVFISFFFPGTSKVDDSRIIPLIEATIDGKHPRKWYYALMDYGADLKKKYPLLLRRSSLYKKQSPFHGSDREIRSKVLRLAVVKKRISHTRLLQSIECDHARLQKILIGLEKDGLIESKNGFFKIKRSTD